MLSVEIWHASPAGQSHRAAHLVNPDKQARYLSGDEGEGSSLPTHCPAFIPLPNNKFSVFPHQTLKQKQTVEGFGICLQLYSACAKQEFSGVP